MSGDLLASKIVIEEEEPKVRTIQGVTTSVAAFEGVTERGPVGIPTRVTSVAEYDGIFGGYVPNGNVRESVDGFFQNGGSDAWINRVVHYGDINNPATRQSAKASVALQSAGAVATGGSVLSTLVAPFELVAGDTLSVDTELGAPAVATFNATAASRESAAGPFALVDGMVLNVSIDGGAPQAISFLGSEFGNIGAATAAEVVAVLNAKLAGAGAQVTNANKVTITSDRKGTGSGVNVSGGTANTPLAFTTGNIAGTGNVSNIKAVSVAEVKTVVEAAVTGVLVSNIAGAVKIARVGTGGAATVQVMPASTAEAKFGFDTAIHAGSAGTPADTLRADGKWEGEYAHACAPKILAASSGDAAEFNWQTIKGGVIVETFPNLTMDPESPRYVETVVNGPTGSRFLAAVDLEAGGTPLENRPANGLAANLSGGDDGLTGLDDTDFVGSSGALGKTGLRCFDSVQDINLLLVPGRATSAVHNAMITYCEVIREKAVFALLDPPANASADEVVTYFGDTAGLLGLSEFAAAYWPRIKVLNPNKSIYGNGDTIVVPPSGHIAGVYARTDGSKLGGVYVPPAGVEAGVLFGCLGFETDEVLEEAKRDIVYPKRINPLTALRGSARHIDGTRTLKGNGNFPSIAERRGAIYIEQSIKDGLQYARHKNNDEELRQSVTRTAESFLRIQMKNGAFRSNDPAKAFFVDFGDGLNPPSVQFAGQLIGRIGIATKKPTDFVILRFSQDTRALEEELAA